MECLKLYCTAVAVVVIQTLSTDSLWPSCEEGRIIFTDEPSNASVDCKEDEVVFPCRYEGTLTHPNWIINSTEYSTAHSLLPYGHSYHSNTNELQVSDLHDGTSYQCFFLSFNINDGTTCAHYSTVGSIKCIGTGFVVQNSAQYSYDDNVLTEIRTTIKHIMVNCYEYVNITYVDTDSGNMCDYEAIDTLFDKEGVYKHRTTSICQNSLSINVTTSATCNGLMTTETTIIDVSNTFVIVNFTSNATHFMVKCAFLNQSPTGMKSCAFTARPGDQNMTSPAAFSEAESSVIVLYLNKSAVVNKTSFELEAQDRQSDNNKVVIVEGKLDPAIIHNNGFNHLLKKKIMIFLFIIISTLFY